MRLLHTADWHLGRTFHGANLAAAQARVLDQVVELAGDERPDAVIVAGDVFDRAYPPLDAVELFDETLKRLADLKLPVVVTSGNHDSAIRLGVNARIAEASGIHIRTRLDRIGAPIQLLGAGGDLLIYAIPYLDPPSTAEILGAKDGTHAGVLGAAIREIADDRARRKPATAVVVAHAVVTGGRSVAEEGTPSTVERSIDVGGVSAVPASVFAGVDYVALGHLHRPQSIGDTVRYSGAPLAFGFDEVGDRKSVTMVELVPGAPARTETVATPVPRAIARVRGTLEDLLQSTAHTEVEDAWIEATVTDRLRPKLAMEQLRRRFPHVLKLDHRPEGRELDGGTAREDYRDRVRGRSETQIAERFLADVRGGIDADDDERRLIAEALEGLAREEALA